MQTIGMAGEAAICAAHAILASRGQWVTNEKQILALTGLDDLDRITMDSGDPGAAVREIRRTSEATAGRLADATE